MIEMKKLISAKDIEYYHETKVNPIVIEEGTIVTALAMDLVEELGLTIERQKPVQQASQDISKEMIVAMLKKLLQGEVSQAFEAAISKEGLKVVNGNSIQFEPLETNNPHAKVFFQEVINEESTAMKAGFLTIEDSVFDYDILDAEISYVVEGNLSLTINGQTYQAKAGDVVYMPKNNTVTFKSEGKTKTFYATCPK